MGKRDGKGHDGVCRVPAWEMTKSEFPNDEHAGGWMRCLVSSALVKIRLAPQIQKTRGLTESEKKSAGFLNLWEIIGVARRSAYRASMGRMHFVIRASTFFVIRIYSFDIPS